MRTACLHDSVGAKHLSIYGGDRQRRGLAYTIQLCKETSLSPLKVAETRHVFRFCPASSGSLGVGVRASVKEPGYCARCVSMSVCVACVCECTLYLCVHILECTPLCNKQAAVSSVLKDTSPENSDPGSRFKSMQSS